ncbi:CDP-alcohol phosphatidyltransferase family protein [Pseudooceanicola atlanticus]|uniref:Phosphatidylcholine synthase n=1 Tax=Pseudooceanicola atlanticus TaxID=1461694 RepID=A0A0A0EAW7_9RHOB|nr:CDP-alcohol phosphatidyltransferase family protein [Pseudooceanicola atlanticus]KGM48111.1 phosphatidylcholine synthase [Pseudooceanicola atlanticus]
MSSTVLRAFSVHLLTATGAVFAMLALLAAVDEKWGIMFLWLVVAFAVDGIDGPLARKYDVTTNAPHIDGALLDLIIDYLTYVFIPVYALFQSGILPGIWAWVVLIGVTFSSGLYFAGSWMKTADKSFHGFPGCWNMLVLVLFATTPPPGVILPIITALAIAMFLPLRFIHPVRTKRWRPVSLSVAALWTVLALIAALTRFDPGMAVQVGLIVSSLYLLGAGMAQQLIDRLR